MSPRLLEQHLSGYQVRVQILGRAVGAESRYLMALQKRGAPLLKHAALSS